MFGAQHSRRRPDFLSTLLYLVGAALLITLAFQFHLLDHSSRVDQGHSYSDQRF